MLPPSSGSKYSAYLSTHANKKLTKGREHALAQADISWPA